MEWVNPSALCSCAALQKLALQSRRNHFRCRRTRSDCAGDGGRQRICHIPNCKYIANTRFLLGTHSYVTKLIQFQLAAKRIRVGLEPNSDQHALHGHLKRLNGAVPFNLNGFHVIATENAVHDGARKYRDAMVSVKLVGELPARAHFPSAVNQSDGRTNFSEQQSIFCGSITAANNANILARELITIAR